MRILASNASLSDAAAMATGVATGPASRGRRARIVVSAFLLAAALAGAAAAQAAAQAADPGATPAESQAAPAAPVTTVTPVAPVTTVTTDVPAAPAAVPAATNPAPEGAMPAAPTPSAPQSATPLNEKAANQQVIEPQIDRRNVRVPHIPSNDFELGVFTGTYETQNFGASLVAGVRAGYDITEDVFVQGVYGQTKVSDQDFRQILPGGIFPTPRETLRYYDLSVGYNIFPGEIFLARNHAKVSTVYVIAGLGTTKFDDASHETVNVGAGLRVFLADWSAVQLDVRDHIFSLNLLGQPQTTQNLELTLGLTFFF
jgi:outer membrane beta-barrel protein